MTITRNLPALLLLSLNAAAALADDWPRFRGANADGISQEKGLLAAWPEKGPEVLWRVPLGGGFSSVAIVGQKSFTMFGKDQGEFLGCLNVTSGKQLWAVRCDDLYKNDSYGDGPRATPAIDAERAYTLSGRGTLDCRLIADGKLLWSKNMLKDFGAPLPEYGYSASPVVFGDKLIVVVGAGKGKSLAALDKMTGKVLWTSLDDRIGYSTPIVEKTDATEQLFVLTGEAIVGTSPEDGHEFWRHPWKTTLDANAATPIVKDNKLFVSTDYDTGCALFALSAPVGKPQAEKLWANKVMKNVFSTSIMIDGFVYGFDTTFLVCVDLHNGKAKWKQRGFNKGSLIAADGKLFIVGEHGELALADASPTAYKERSKTKIFDDREWTMPTLSDGRLFLRDEKELVCLKVK